MSRSTASCQSRSCSAYFCRHRPSWVAVRLRKQELQSFADDLTTFASQRLNTPKEYITIAYTEVPAEAWKESVFDTEIAPNVDKLLRKPQYSM
mgnify:CR=1 FL=1